MVNKKVVFAFVVFVALFVFVASVSAFNLPNWVKNAIGSQKAGAGITGNPIYDDNSDGLVSVYHFKEIVDGIDGRSVGGSPGSVDGIVMGGAQIVNNGVDGNSISLDGLDDYISFSNSYQGFNMSGKDMTMSVWVYRTGAGYYDRIFTRYYNAGTFGGYALGITDTSKVWYFTGNGSTGGSSWSYSRNVIDPNRWYHIVVTQSGTNASLYIDGVRDSSWTKQRISGVAPTITQIAGLKSAYLSFNGSIDELMIYNKALSASEVTALYNNQRGRLISGGGGGGGGSKPINGVCGATNNSCVNGTFSDVADNSTHYLWKCNGINGGTEVACSLAKSNQLLDSEYCYLQNTNNKLCLFNNTLYNITNNGGCGVSPTNITLRYGGISENIVVMQGTSVVLRNGVVLHNLGAPCAVWQLSLQFSNSVLAQCIDSDGGLNYYVKGNVTFFSGIEIFYDSCFDDRVQELYCEKYYPAHYYVNDSFICPNGCVDGACLPDDSQVCSALISKNGIVRNNYGSYNLVSNHTEYFPEFEDGRFSAHVYSAEYAKIYGDDAMSINMLVLNGSTVEGWGVIDEIKDDVWNVGVFNSSIYYQLFNDGRQYHIWYNQNVMVYVLFYKLISVDSVLPKNFYLNEYDIIRAIQGNEFTSFGDFIREKEVLDNVLGDIMPICESEVSESCIPIWEKKVEPVVCPEYGRQKVLLRDLRGCSGGSFVRETSEICSPGICSGCYVPRWMYKGISNDNVCVPYGTRLENGELNKEKILLYEKEGSGKPGSESMKIISADEAEVTFYWYDENYTYSLIKGNSYQFYLPYGELQWFVENINVEEKYVEIVATTRNVYDAYCSYYGYIDPQRGDDASCQNNYECFSNECRSGQCVNTYVEVTKQANILVKILCRLTNFPLLGGTEDGYQQCLIDYSSPSTPPPSGGGGGGGSGGGGGGGGFTPTPGNP